MRYVWKGAPGALLLCLLLSAGLLCGMLAVSASRRIWLAQPALGLPAVGPVNSAPFSAQLKQAVAQDARFNRWASREQQRQIRQLCGQILARRLFVVTARGERQAVRQCRIDGFRAAR